MVARSRGPRLTRVAQTMGEINGSPLSEARLLLPDDAPVYDIWHAKRLAFLSAPNSPAVNGGSLGSFRSPHARLPYPFTSMQTNSSTCWKGFSLYGGTAAGRISPPARSR